MDIPLLFEQDYVSWFDETWLVYVDRYVQVERLMKRDHLSKNEAEFRLAAQWPLEKKKYLASHVLNNMEIKTSFLLRYSPCLREEAR